MLSSRMLNRRVDVRRRVLVGRDRMNNPVYDWRTIARDIPAYIERSPYEGAAGEMTVGADVQRAEFTVVVRAGTDVTGRDRLIVTDRPDRMTLEVYGPPVRPHVGRRERLVSLRARWSDAMEVV